MLNAAALRRENFLPAFGGTRAVMVGSAIAAMKITNSVPPLSPHVLLVIHSLAKR